MPSAVLGRGALVVDLVVGFVVALSVFLLEETSRNLLKPFVGYFVRAVEHATKYQLLHRLQ